MSPVMNPGWTREVSKGQPSPREAGGSGECKTGGRIPGGGDVEKDDHGPEGPGGTGEAAPCRQSRGL